ncbi:MAG: hypothetical protein IK075_12240 [Prevotella sp.]|nr:hypothetical protein [Prevotella sp.]
MNELKNDTNLREAVSRREQKLPPLPADLNERLMESLSSMPPQESGNQARFSSLSLWRGRRVWLLLAAAASIALFIIFHPGKEQTPQNLGSSELSGTPVVAQQIEKQNPQQPTPAVSEPVEEPGLVTEKPKSVKKQRKVMQLVELIPTSEAKSDNVKELPASLIAKVKAYEQASDPSRTTGIDDGTDAIVTTTMGIDDTDPLVAMTAQVESIRQRGQRLEREIELKMDD